MSERIEEISQTSTIYKLIVGLPHHPLFRVTHFSLKSYDTYNLTVGASRLLENPCHPILKLVLFLSILGHFLGSLLWIVGLAGSQNLQFLIDVPCAHHLRTSFQVCN